MTIEERNRLIESYGKAYDHIKAAISQFPREMWQWRPGPGKWSIHENLVHLADSEANSFVRCRRLIAEPGSGVYGYDQDAWAIKMDYHSQSPDEALELFGMLRSMSYKLMKKLPEEVWSHTIQHSEKGALTFPEWLRMYEEHTHIGQMKRTYDAWVNSQEQAL